ncbi:MAG TPA: NADP-dependent phosphogluconate dehydrogenase [Vicinamibacterales bacterium]|nr:NADP-dependent phosphogluconate dehydrogenase [Vicinamibacterales bacterium]
MSGSNFGVVGLGTMGRNLALNIESHGNRVAVWNLETDWITDFISKHPGAKFEGTPTFEQFTAALSRPRRIIMMIPAGKPVDATIAKLQPLLDRGDVLIDGGNSWFEDTRRREAALRPTGIHFVGCGVSGGEEGARFGPSLMPGGSTDAWAIIRDVLESIAAKTEAGPCVTHVGPDGAGHFVKMVHNGIEYGDMQLIAESWDVLRRGLGLSAPETADVFEKWNNGPLASFLTELTARVCRTIDTVTKQPLVDVVLDKAGQKGTGKWTAQVALDLAVAIPTIAAAIDARVLSSLKDERTAASKVLQGPTPAVPEHGQRSQLIDDLHDALYAARICAYAQGMALIRAGSDKYQWNINLAEIGRIWKGGCIIRARLLDPVRQAFEGKPDLVNLLLDATIRDRVHKAQAGWRRTVTRAADAGIPMLAHSSALAYFDSYRTARLPQSLTQAQRDAFGAHTYERIDRPGAVHSEW